MPRMALKGDISVPYLFSDLLPHNCLLSLNAHRQVPFSNSQLAMAAYFFCNSCFALYFYVWFAESEGFLGGILKFTSNNLMHCPNHPVIYTFQNGTTRAGMGVAWPVSHHATCTFLAAIDGWKRKCLFSP